MTDQQQPRPPLWRVMQSVYYDTFSLCKSERKCRADEIRAVADEVGERFRLPTLETFVNLDTILHWLRNEARRAEVDE